MAVNPVWTVISAQAQSGFNRMRRFQGKVAIWITVLLVIAILATMVLPLVLSLGFLGYVLGDSLQGGLHSDRNLGMITIFFSGVVLVGGVLGGLGGSNRQLPWESLKAYPVSPWALFIAEYFAGAVDVLTAIQILAMVGLAVGISLATPGAIPFLIFLVVCLVPILLSLHLLIGSLTERLSRQTRAMIIVLPLAALAIPFLIPRVTAMFSDAKVFTVGTAILESAIHSPVGFVLRAARSALQGEWGDVAPALGLLLTITLGLIPITYLAVSREADLGDQAETGSGRPLWTFTTPMWGLARLQWETLTTSLMGKSAMLMPLLTVVLFRFPMSELAGKGAWLVPGAFLYAGLSGTNMLFNQFGLDRHGVKVLMLLPIDEGDLLLGKSLGLAAWQGVQIVALVLLLMLTGNTDPSLLALGVMVALCTFLIFLTVGQFVSVLLPRPLSKSGMQASQPPILVVIITLITVSLSSLSLMGAVALSRFLLGDGLAWVGMVLVALGLLGATFPARRACARSLKAHREHLVETLGAAA